MNGVRLKHHEAVIRMMAMIFDGTEDWSGVWLCGGAARAYVMNTPFHDMDFMFRDADLLDDFYDHLIELGAAVTHRRSNLIELRLDKVVIQLAFYAYYDSPEDVINDFDFTCCKFALDHKLKVYYDVADRRDAVDKRLRIQSLKYPLFIMQRLAKYTKDGYTGDDKFWEDVAESLATLPNEVSPRAAD